MSDAYEAKEQCPFTKYRTFDDGQLFCIRSEGHEGSHEDAFGDKEGEWTTQN